MSLLEAVRTGRLAGLVALRDALAEAIEGGEEPSTAPIAKQLRETLAEIEALSKTQKGSKVDDLARRRQARRAETPSSGVAAGGGQ